MDNNAQEHLRVVVDKPGEERMPSLHEERRVRRPDTNDGRPSPTPHLDERMAAMMALLGTDEFKLHKLGRTNDSEKMKSYSFVKAGDVAGVIQRAAAACGVAIYTQEVSITWLAHPHRPRMVGAPPMTGGPRVVEVTLGITFSADGEQRTILATAEGVDYGDGAKALGKARSYALKYALIGQFQLAPDDELDEYRETSDEKGSGEAQGAQGAPRGRGRGAGKAKDANGSAAPAQGSLRPSPEEPKMTPEQWEEMDKMLAFAKVRSETEEAICHQYGVSHLKDLTVQQAANALSIMQARLNKRQAPPAQP